MVFSWSCCCWVWQVVGIDQPFVFPVQHIQKIIDHHERFLRGYQCSVRHDVTRILLAAATSKPFFFVAFLLSSDDRRGLLCTDKIFYFLGCLNHLIILSPSSFPRRIYHKFTRGTPEHYCLSNIASSHAVRHEILNIIASFVGVRNHSLLAAAYRVTRRFFVRNCLIHFVMGNQGRSCIQGARRTGKQEYRKEYPSLPKGSSGCRGALEH